MKSRVTSPTRRALTVRSKIETMKFIVVSCIVVLAFIFSAEARVRLSSGSSRVKLSSPSKSSGNGKSWFSNSGGGPKAQVGTQPRGPTAPVPQPGQLTRGVGFGGEQVPSASGLRSGIRNVGGAVRGYVGGILQSPETQDFLQQAVGGVMNYQQ